MENQAMLDWWRSVEVETILRGTLYVEGFLIVAIAAIFFLWSHWEAYRDARLKVGLDDMMKSLVTYIVNQQDIGKVLKSCKYHSTFFLVQLIHHLDNLPTNDASQVTRKGIVREKIFAMTLTARACRLAHSRFAGRRAVALSCFRLAPRIENETIISELMRDSVPVLRLGAARLALRIGSEQCVSAIIHFLKNEKRYVRNLIRISAQEASPAFVEKIRRRFVDEKDVYVQKLCMDLISTHHVDEVDGEFIFSLTKSSNKEMRISALRSLCASKCRKAYLALTESMVDPEWEVRAAASRLIGEQRFPEGIVLLSKAMQDANWWVRSNASSSLSQMGTPGENALRSMSSSQDRFVRETAELALKINQNKVGMIQ